MKIKVNQIENKEVLEFIKLDNGVIHSCPSRNIPF